MVTGISRFTKGAFNQDALDEVWNKGKETFRDPIPSPSSGIVFNTTDEIWDDMHERNTGWVSNMPGGSGQFNGPYDQPKADIPMQERGDGPYDRLNVWVEVEAGGTGAGCSEDINTATNTRVEIGYTRGFIRVGGKWQQYTLDGTQQKGEADGYPNQGSPSEHSREPCDITRYDWSITSIRRTEPSGYYSTQPRGYKRWHGWTQQTSIPHYSDIEVIYGSLYLRLIVDDTDPTKEDDRGSANYVAHTSCDIRMTDSNGDSKYIGDVVISRYKQIPANGDWIPLSFITGLAGGKAELEANPPPLFTTP